METSIKIVGFILRVLTFLLTPIFWFLARKPSKKLPPIVDPLLLKSATQLAELIIKKQITSENVIEAYIKRIRDVNPYLNAVVEERFTAAICEAKNVDKLIASTKDEEAIRNLRKNKPLLGVPLTVKESCGLAGMSQSVGSLDRAEIKAIQDSDAVLLLRSAGAIPLLISNTSELCLGWESNNLITGQTNNPYCLHRTSGGSSGGEAALIASAASVIGIGSDIAGSIRIPAMFSGIFGHKPSPGTVSVKGHYPFLEDERFELFHGVGPLTRYADDLLPMLKIMTGKNAELLELEKPVDLKNVKIFYMTEAARSFYVTPVEKDITIAMKKSLEYLKHTCGSKIEEVALKEMENSVEISISIFFEMDGIETLFQDGNNPKVNRLATELLSIALVSKRNIYIEMLKNMLGMSSCSLQKLAFAFLHETNLFIPKAASPEYHLRAQLLKNKIEKLLNKNGVFLYPTFPTSAFYHNQIYIKASGVMYAMIFNILGLPSTHVPLGLNSEGLPIGIQVVAAPKQDRLCIAVASALEKGFGGWIAPPTNS